MSAIKSLNGQSLISRRGFLGSSAAAAATILCRSTMADAAGPESTTDLNLLGPRSGYSPQIGAFVSELTWMREMNGVLTSTKNLNQADLDFLFDKGANTIGALMLHLAAIETYYQMNTFEGVKWQGWSDAVRQKWDAAGNLGDAGRKIIKGHDREYYVDILRGVREKTLAEFRKRDDAWFLIADKDWPWGPTNNHCKWFHVCEHEAHHTGQIAMLRKRLPDAKPSSD